MGFFDKLMGKAQPASVTFPIELGAPALGTVVAMADIPDAVFSIGVLGTCVGVDPSEGKVYAPVDGKITQLAETLHAVGLEAGGMEILIHVGVDTVEMKGDGFKSLVKEGQTVKKGDLLMTIDIGKIAAAGHPATVIMALTNTDDFASVEATSTGTIQPGNSILRVSK